jgi:hypothetical protein
VPVPAVQVRTRALWVPPVGRWHPSPPGAPVAQIDRATGRAEHQCPRDQQVRVGVGVVGRVGRPLGHGHVPGGLDEAAELGVGHRVPVDPEPVHLHLMDGPLLGVEVLGAHQEHPPRHPHHVLGRRRTQRALGVSGHRRRPSTGRSPRCHLGAGHWFGHSRVDQAHPAVLPLLADHSSVGRYRPRGRARQVVDLHPMPSVPATTGIRAQPHRDVGSPLAKAPVVDDQDESAQITMSPLSVQNLEGGAAIPPVCTPSYSAATGGRHHPKGITESRSGRP